MDYFRELEGFADGVNAVTTSGDGTAKVSTSYYDEEGQPYSVAIYYALDQLEAIVAAAKAHKADWKKFKTGEE